MSWPKSDENMHREHIRASRAGESHLLVQFEALAATAILLKVDGAINEENRDSRSKVSMHV